MSLSDTNLKFANYAERTILRGETVIQVIYQPAIQLALGSLLGFSFSRRVSPAHLCILTDRELILLADDDSQTWLRGSPHGAIWRYIPLTKIRFASLVLDRGDLISLRLQLPGDVRLESVFSAAKKGDLEHLQRQLCPRA